MIAKQGLVLGKFYPPHRGHELLIRAAAAASERLCVVVAGSRGETIELADRVAWLGEMLGDLANVSVDGARDVPGDFADDAAWQAHAQLAREAAARGSAVPIDAVFSSAACGEQLALRLGARHVAVDPARELEPISAAAVRADPQAFWAELPAPVRSGLALRLAIVGAESTGKSTLAADLVARLRLEPGALSAASSVREFGREFTLWKLAAARARASVEARPAPSMDDLVWTRDDFVEVARAQNALERAAARGGGPVVVCDTDAFATSLWYERYLGERSPEVEGLERPPERRLYLLTHPADVAFAPDGIRDGERIRAWMTDLFATRLRERGMRWQWLRGGRAERLEAALAATRAFAHDGWELAQPGCHVGQASLA